MVNQETQTMARIASAVPMMHKTRRAILSLQFVLPLTASWMSERVVPRNTCAAVDGSTARRPRQKCLKGISVAPKKKLTGVKGITGHKRSRMRRVTPRSWTALSTASNSGYLLASFRACSWNTKRPRAMVIIAPRDIPTQPETVPTKIENSWLLYDFLNAKPAATVSSVDGRNKISATITRAETTNGPAIGCAVSQSRK